MKSPDGKVSLSVQANNQSIDYENNRQNIEAVENLIDFQQEVLGPEINPRAAEEDDTGHQSDETGD
jgi:hypothetical protein